MAEASLLIYPIGIREWKAKKRLPPSIQRFTEFLHAPAGGILL